MSTERRPQLLRVLRVVGTWAFFLALPFAVLWRFAPFFSKTTIGNDYAIYPIDAQLEYVWAWSHGMVPLYVPGFAGGSSAAGMTLGQAWHPITWIASVIPGYGRGHAEVILTALRFLELGITHRVIYVESRGSGLGRAPAFLLSFVAVFNGRMLDSFRYGASLEGYCGMLLICAAFASAHRQGWSTRRVALAAGAVYLTLVSGHPQWALFGVLAAGFFGLSLPLCARHLGAPPPTGDRLRYMGGFALACALGGILSAGYVLPFLLEFMAQNAGRVDQSYDFTVGYGDTLRGTFANLFRPLESDVHGAFGGSVVTLVVLCSLPAVLITRRRVPVGLLAPLGVLLVAVLFSMGKATPVHRWMVDHLPLFSSFRVPGRVNLWIPPMMLVLGWITLADLARPELRRAWCKPPAVVVGAALALVALLVFHALQPDVYPSPTSPLTLPGVTTWATTALFALFGVGAAMLAMMGANPTTRRSAWAIAIGSTIAAAAIALPYGTWSAAREKTRTLEAIDSHHRKRLTFIGDPGYGMGTKLAAQATEDKISLKRKAGTLKGGTVKPRAIHWNAWTFDVTAPKGGTFVFGQPHLPEWRATVDGRPVAITTAEGVFAAVALEPGEHVVSFRFVSIPTSVGGGLFFATLAGFAVALFLRSPARRRTRAIVLGVALATITASAALWFRAQSPALNLVEPEAAAGPA